MIAYEMLDDAGQLGVARERVLELEREHFRLRLLIAEAQAVGGDVGSVIARITEIERRHAVHTEEPPALDAEGGADAEADNSAPEKSDAALPTMVAAEPELADAPVPATTSRNGAKPR